MKARVHLWFAALFLVSFSAVAIALPPLAGHVLLTRQQVVADLVFLRDVWAPKERSFTPETRRRMAAYVNDEIAHARAMEKTQLALVMSRAMAFTGNNHTHTGWWNEVDSYQVAPFSFWWFPEGAMVTRAHPGERDLLGAELLAIGGVPIRQVYERVIPYIPGTSDTHLAASPAWIRRFEVLQALGLSDGETASFTFRLANGRTATRRFGPPPRFADADRYPDPAQYSDPWRQSMVPGKGPDPWPHVLDKLAALPLYLQPPASVTSSELDHGRILYIRSNTLNRLTDDGPSVQSQAYHVVNDALRDGIPPRHVIVDVRYNLGGDFLSITNLVTEIVRMTAPDGRIYVITGRSTNSAAIAFAALLKGSAPVRTKFVGEHPSDRPRFWSEGDDLKSPSGIPLHYTTGYHDWAEGCRDFKRCYWPVVIHGTAVRTLNPDIPVSMTFKQYVAGEDPALEAALADIARYEQGRE